MWNLLPDSRAVFDVTAPGPRRTQRNGHRPSLAGGLDQADRDRADGIPVTSVARTLLDLAATVAPRLLRRGHLALADG